MTSKDKSKATQGLPNGTNPDEHCVNEFFHLISTYLSKNGFQKLQQIFAERDDLQDQLESTKRTLSEMKETLADCVMKVESGETKFKKLEEKNNSHIDENTKLKQDLDQIKQKHKEKLDEIKQQQDAEAKTLTKLQKIAKQHEKAKEELQKSLDTNEKLVHSLQEKKALARQLDELKTYSADMVSWETLNSDTIAGLTEVSTRGLQWAKDFLLQDLNEDALSQENWDKIKDNQFLKDYTVSLPASNSPSAKQVRYTLGLMVLGQALEDYIFQPLYLSVIPAETEGFLNLLGSKDTAQQEHARSVLRKVFDAEQTQVGTMRAESAAQVVMGYLSGLVPTEKHDACSSELLSICNLALTRWKPVLDLKELVTVASKRGKDNSTRWQTLSFPPQENNKNEGTAKGGSKNGTSQKKPGQNSTARNLDTEDMDAYEVWPLIYVKDKVLHQGLCVTGDPFDAARDELFEEIKKREESQRREARKRDRKSSDVATGRPDTGRRSSSSFPSSGFFSLGAGIGPRGG